MKIMTKVIIDCINSQENVKEDIAQVSLYDARLCLSRVTNELFLSLSDFLPVACIVTRSIQESDRPPYPILHWPVTPIHSFVFGLRMVSYGRY